MRSEQSPFPLHWWGTGIDNVAERPDVGTYGRYKFALLPTLPFQMRGEFDWLTTGLKNAIERKDRKNHEYRPNPQLALKPKPAGTVLNLGVQRRSPTPGASARTPQGRPRANKIRKLWR